MRWMVSLGIEGRRESQHFGRAELHAKAASLAALDHNRNPSFGHETPTLEHIARSNHWEIMAWTDRRPV